MQQTTLLMHKFVTLYYIYSLDNIPLRFSTPCESVFSAGILIPHRGDMSSWCVP